MQGDVERSGGLARFASLDVQCVDAPQHLLRRREGRGADLGAIAGDHREGRQHAVAHELQHLAAMRHDGLDHAVEIVVEQHDQLAARHRVAERREAPQVGEEDHGLDALDLAAQHGTGEHAARRIVAEIGRQQSVPDPAQARGLCRHAEDRQHLAQDCDVLLGKAAGPVGRGRDGEPQPLGMIGLGRAADLRRQLAERLHPAHPLGHVSVAQLVEHRNVGQSIGSAERLPQLGDTVAQHRRKRALLDLRRIDIGMGELEMPGDTLARSPDQAARPHHGMQRIHAHEHALDPQAGLVEAAAETVDQVLEGHVAQAGLRQPAGHCDGRHRALTPPGASSFPPAGRHSDRRCRSVA